MNDSADRLQALLLRQEREIKALKSENQELKTQIRTLEKQVDKLEETRMAIDFATADIPVDLDLVPEDINGQSGGQ